MVQATGPSAPAKAPPRAPGSIVDAFLATRDWARNVVAIHDAVHATVQRELGPLLVAPTTHAPDGVLSVQSLDGESSEFRLRTHRQDGGPISHKVFTTMAMPKFGMLYSKTAIHACLPQGTPFLDVELAGSQASVLMAIFLTPRLATLRHIAYTAKYYRSLPPGVTASSDGSPLLTFTQLCARAKARAEASPGLAMVSSPAGGGQADSTADAAAAARVYKFFHSNQLWTRLMAGHGLLFQFDPDGPGLEAASADVAALVALWCEWVKADWADGTGAPLEGALLEECRDMSRVMANYLEQDEDTQAAERIVGPAAGQRLRETASGHASLAGKPWWVADQ